MGALIYDYTVPSATTSITISNLNIQKGELYELTSFYVNPAGLYTNYDLLVNGNTTRTNYWFQYLSPAGTSLASLGRVNAAEGFGTNANTSGQASTYIKLTNNGYFVWQSDFNRNVGLSNASSGYHYGSSTFTSSSITSIEIRATQSNGIGTNSRFQLRKVGQLVQDYEVPSSTSSIVIPDLDITKDDEYLLVSDYVNDGTGRSHTLYINGDVTASRYWTQYFYVYSGTIGAARENKAITVSGTTNQRSLAITKLKLTNDGYWTWQTSSTRTYGTSSVEIGKAYGTYTIPTNKVTQINIQPTELHNIGAGSRFELYKLYEAPRDTQSYDTYELLYDSDTAGVTYPTTQIDITGLNITKDDELRMVYTFVGDDASNTSNIELRVNDITSNYNIQVLNGDGSSITAFRESNGQFVIARSNRKAVGFADIKVNNNDRFVVQSQFISRAGADSSSITNFNRNLVNTSTVTNITKLSIVSSRTNGIATGSRIRLYKVNTGAA